MKPVTWDSGLRWDDPNLRWGDPSYLLEPGDPGYVAPLNPAKPTKTPRTMSNNAIPDAEKPVLALAEDCADGCADLEDSIPLKLIRETDLRGPLLTLKGDPTAAPPTPGLIYIYKDKELALANAAAARGTKDNEVKTFLSDVRKNLIRFLGSAPSPEWELAGFGSAQSNSNAVPSTQDARLQALAQLRPYLLAHPAYEQAAGTPAPEVTAARALALHTQLSDARAAANAAADAQDAALIAKRAVFATLRGNLSTLVVELNRALAPDDSRWETFGLNIPANPRPPEPATALTLTTAGTGRVLAEWERGTRSSDDRVLIQIVGVDTACREYAKSGGDGEHLIKDQPSGAVLKVRILALNGSLEAPSGPEAQISVV